MQMSNDYSEIPQSDDPDDPLAQTIDYASAAGTALRQIWNDWQSALAEEGIGKSTGDEEVAAFLHVSVETFIAVRDKCK